MNEEDMRLQTNMCDSGSSVDMCLAGVTSVRVRVHILTNNGNEFILRHYTFDTLVQSLGNLYREDVLALTEPWS